MRLSIDLSILFLLAIALSLPAEHCQEAEIISPGSDFGGARAVRMDQGSNYLADQQFQIEREEEHIGQIQGDAGGFKGPEIWQVMPEAGKDQGFANLPLLSLAIEPLSGFAPLVVGFRVFGTEQISYAKWELDMEGDNKFEIAEYGTPVAQVTYYAPGTYFPRFLFYDNRGQVIAYAQGRVDVQGQPGIAMGELANPLPLVPKIEYFNGPTSVRAGENLTLTWKVLNATCGVRLDGKEVNPTDSYTYTVPMQKAPYTIRHLLMVYGEPCDKPVPYGKYLDVPFLEREPNAPKEFKFTGWTEKGDWPVANFEWKDNSYNEDGFWVYRGEEYVGSRPANNTTISILPEISCGASFTYYVTAYNGMGKSAPSNFVTVEDICPPTKRILDFSVGPGQSGIEYIFIVLSRTYYNFHLA